ncbi:hypothetical protein I316_05070 [Kwoniella heveanensis BCC8398]|uniref:DNA recombination and repair protein Rad51-like C-terminal domain-containing protein n=1 Tax=Kwoniella heveanensis BCC8398 TaxID=1296120 RepID=A0A1B9GQF8_9TREE|nr:hypothetical protein I316_05070 [Kwoniella heveanensis BCC8398]
MLLKRIADVLPAELAELIPELESVGIRTTESLIFTPPTYILSHIPLLQSVQLDALITSSLELTAPKALRDGQDERDEDDGSEESAWAGWGISGLDDVVAGWNGIGVMEIAGPKKVGKWIDTEGSFVPERAMRVLEYQGVKDVNRVLQRLVVIPCFKLDDVFEAIAQLSEVSARTRTSNLCHAELVSLTEEISELAYEHGMTAIIINSAVSSQPTNSQSSFNKMDIKPALGGAFTFCTDLTLLLQETGRIFGLMDANERERIRSEPGLRALVEVVRSRVCPSGKWTVFETDGAKLLDVIPPHEVDERTTRISAGLPTGPARPAIGSLAQTLAP